jgi:hypothetical protein
MDGIETGNPKKSLAPPPPGGRRDPSVLAPKARNVVFSEGKGAKNSENKKIKNSLVVISS